MPKLIGRMARMYPMLIIMGFMTVVVAFIVGYFNSQAAAAYFAESKAVRETTLLAERASIESIGLWLPYLKFLGIGLILGGIVMALRVIIDNLMGAGAEVLSNLPSEVRPAPPIPSLVCEAYADGHDAGTRHLYRCPRRRARDRG